MIIDAHVHFWDSFMDFRCPGVEEIIAGMDRCGISMSYVSSLSALLSSDPRSDNDRIAAIVAAHPHRFRGVAVVDPYSGRAALEELERCLGDLRFAGLKLHPWLQGYYACAEFLDPLLELCRAYDVPVIFHTGTPPYAQPFEVAYHAERHPKVRFVLAHMGLGDEWRDAIETGLRCANTYFDTSGMSFQFAIGRLVRTLGPERVLFGSDNPFLFPEIELLRIEELMLSPAARERVLSGTARELFGA